jgi:SAM-dependent methyltransferase
VTHWESWHGAYADPESALSRRLRIVQDQIAEWLDRTAPEPVHVVSVCAGDGRDLLDVLAGRDDADRVHAALIELDPSLASRARTTATSFPGVEVRTADAGDPGSYAGVPDADLVLLCGVLGNISDTDVRHTIEVLPALCADGARVIWTRTRRAPDLTPDVRTWFADNGFHEVGFYPVADSSASVGVSDLKYLTRRPLDNERLFTFVATSTNDVTLAAYERRSDSYRAALRQPPPWHVAFLNGLADALPTNASVLELGSGTGDNARYLAAHGLSVQPSDAAASFVTQMRVDGLRPLTLNVLFDEVGGPWDAIVALAMLLHLTRDELSTVLEKLHAGIRPGGLLAFSVKEGDGAGWSEHKLGLPRYFTYWRAEPLRRLLNSSGWEVTSLECHSGQRDDWLYVVAVRLTR